MLNAELEQKIMDFSADLKFLFEKKRISSDEIDDVISKLKTNEVKTYLETLKNRSKPEDALKYSFFGGDSILSKFFGKFIPEVSMVAEDGWVDYTIDLGVGRPVLLELKSLFIAETD